MTTHGWQFGVSDVANLPTSETNTGKVLAPDGSGGLTWVTASAGVTDHGALTGLGDDDHTQYHNDSRALTWHGAFASTHVTGGDSHAHSAYLAKTGADTGASSQKQLFTNGVQSDTWYAQGSSLTIKSSTGTTWFTLSANELQLNVYPANILMTVEGALKTESDGWWHGIYVKNNSNQEIAHFRPDLRSVGIGPGALSSAGAAALGVTTASPYRAAFIAYAHASQVVDVVKFVDKTGAEAYRLTYENIHNFLGNVNVAGRVSSAPAFDRLQGANQRYGVTFTNCTFSNADGLFDGSHSTVYMKMNAATEGNVEIDFNPFVGYGVNTATGFTYWSGQIYCSFFGANIADTVWLDCYYYGGGGAGVDGWQTSLASVQNNVSNNIQFTVPINNYLKKIKIRFSHASHEVWVQGINYFPDTPEAIYEMAQLPRFASERAKLANKGMDYYDTGWTVRHSMDYQVANGATAVAYMHDTTNALSTSGAKLATWKNNGTLKMSIDKDGQLIPVGGILLSAANVATDTTTGAQWGTSSSQKQAWWGATPVVRPSAYTQTYSTADKTLSAYTSDPESSAYTGIDNAQGGTPYAKLTDLNALRVAYDNLRTFSEDLAAFVNSWVDDAQTIGLVG